MGKPSLRFVWIALAAVAGFVVGLAGATWFSGWFLGYGTSARLISDATTDVAALEHLTAGDAKGAEYILKVRLEASMIGLDAARDRLTGTQASQVKTIESRAEKFLGEQRE